MGKSVKKACQERYFVFVSDVNDFVEVRSKSDYILYRDLLSLRGVSFRERSQKLSIGTFHSMWPLG